MSEYQFACDEWMLTKKREMAPFCYFRVTLLFAGTTSKWKEEYSVVVPATVRSVDHLRGHLLNALASTLEKLVRALAVGAESEAEMNVICSAITLQSQIEHAISVNIAQYPIAQEDGTIKFLTPSKISIAFVDRDGVEYVCTKN